MKSKKNLRIESELRQDCFVEQKRHSFTNQDRGREQTQKKKMMIRVSRDSTKQEIASV